MRGLTKFLFLLLVLGLGAQHPASAQGFSPAQRQELDKIIHDYLQRHPEAIMESLKVMQRKTETENAERQRKMILAKRDELVADADSVVAGNPKGDVTLVEFFDYRCPYCKQIEPALDALIKEDGKLRVVYKEFPILGPISVYASRVAIASRKQGKYEAFHARMMALKGAIDEAAIMKVASSVGLDLAKLKSDMASAEVDKIIQRNFALAETLGIDGTPGLIVGDTLTMGAVDLDGLRQIIAAARKKSS